MILAMEAHQPLVTGVAPVVAGVDTAVKARSIPQTLPLASGGVVVAVVVAMEAHPLEDGAEVVVAVVAPLGGATLTAKCIIGKWVLLQTGQLGKGIDQDTRGKLFLITQ